MNEHRILLIDEVAERLRVSHSSINRWLGQARRGESTFPLPISAVGGKRRWIASDIDRWLQQQSIDTMPTPARTKRSNTKARQERQAATDRALDRFRTRKGADARGGVKS